MKSDTVCHFKLIMIISLILIGLASSQIANWKDTLNGKCNCYANIFKDFPSDIQQAMIDELTVGDSGDCIYKSDGGVFLLSKSSVTKSLGNIRTGMLEDSNVNYQNVVNQSSNIVSGANILKSSINKDILSNQSDCSSNSAKLVKSFMALNVSTLAYFNMPHEDVCNKSAPILPDSADFLSLVKNYKISNSQFQNEYYSFAIKLLQEVGKNAKYQTNDSVTIDKVNKSVKEIKDTFTTNNSDCLDATKNADDDSALSACILYVLAGKTAADFKSQSDKVTKSLGSDTSKTLIAYQQKFNSIVKQAVTNSPGNEISFKDVEGKVNSVMQSLGLVKLTSASTSTTASTSSASSLASSVSSASSKVSISVEVSSSSAAVSSSSSQLSAEASSVSQISSSAGSAIYSVDSAASEIVSVESSVSVKSDPTPDPSPSPSPAPAESAASEASPIEDVSVSESESVAPAPASCTDPNAEKKVQSNLQQIQSFLPMAAGKLPAGMDINTKVKEITDLMRSNDCSDVDGQFTIAKNAIMKLAMGGRRLLRFSEEGNLRVLVSDTVTSSQAASTASSVTSLAASTDLVQSYLTLFGTSKNSKSLVNLISFVNSYIIDGANTSVKTTLQTAYSILITNPNVSRISFDLLLSNIDSSQNDVIKVLTDFNNDTVDGTDTYIAITDTDFDSPNLKTKLKNYKGPGLLGVNLTNKLKIIVLTLNERYSLTYISDGSTINELSKMIVGSWCDCINNSSKDTCFMIPPTESINKRLVNFCSMINARDKAESDMKAMCSSIKVPLLKPDLILSCNFKQPDKRNLQDQEDASVKTYSSSDYTLDKASMTDNDFKVGNSTPSKRASEDDSLSVAASIEAHFEADSPITYNSNTASGYLLSLLMLFCLLAFI